MQPVILSPPEAGEESLKISSPLVGEFRFVTHAESCMNGVNREIKVRGMLSTLTLTPVSPLKGEKNKPTGTRRAVSLFEWQKLLTDSKHLRYYAVNMKASIADGRRLPQVSRIL